MSERERWVVYPLLFLALGASLRDKLGGRLTAKSIVCQELVIEDEPIGNLPPNPLAVLHRVQPDPNRPAVAALQIEGEIFVDGAVKVDGGINAKLYALQGIPLLPIYQTVPVPSAPAGTPPAKKPVGSNAGAENALPSRDRDPQAPPATKQADETAPQN